MFRTILTCATVLAIAGAASAGDTNPFLGKASMPVQESPKTVKKELGKHVASALPPFPGPFRPGGLPLAQGGPDSQPAKKAPTWRIIGRVNDKVSLADLYTGAISLLDNGEVIDGCIIDYPSIICDQDQKANARARQNVKKDQQAVAAERTKLAANKATQDKDLDNIKLERDKALAAIKAIFAKAVTERASLESENKKLSEDLLKAKILAIAADAGKDQRESEKIAAKKEADKLAADFEKIKKDLAAAKLALDDLKLEVPPAWFDSLKSHKYLEKSIGEVDVITKGGQILALRSLTTRIEIMDTSLAKYIRGKIISGGYVYYQVSGLVMKGES